ncbi:MAG: hypothetical protein K0R45_2375 [Pseudomonas sp.]|nr:hypothetical protein [Pseudomonas sp.]
MSHEITRFRTAEYLKTLEDMAHYLNACLEEDLGDGALVHAALNDIASAAERRKSPAILPSEQVYRD